MPSTATRVIDGLSTSVAVKAPCAVVFTSNNSLSGLQGYDPDTRGFCVGQTNPIDNGIYLISSGQWQRAPDADGNRDLVKGTRVLVESGGDGIGYELVSDNPIVIGTTPLVFELREIDSALRSDLASTTSGADGALLVGFRRTETGSVAQSVANVLRRRVFAEDFGVTFDGTTDDTSALNAAITALGGRGVVYLSKGTLKVTSQILPPAGVKLIGQGNTCDNTINGATRILRAFAGANATVVLQDDGALELIDIDNNNQGTGECVQVKGSRVHVVRVTGRKSGGDVFRLGATEGGAATFNANCWRIDHCIALNSTGKALYIDHQSTPPAADATQSTTTTNGLAAATLSAPNASIRRGQFVSGTGIAAGTRVASVSGVALLLDTAATASGTNALTFRVYPVGVPDMNAGTLTEFDARLCGDGIVVENAIDCVIVGGVVQQCPGKGFWMKRYARGWKIDSLYTEANGIEGQIDSGAHKNRIIGANRFTLTSSGWVINDTDNIFEEFHNGLENLAPGYRLTRYTPWNPAAGGEASFDMLAESGAAMYAQLVGKKDTGAGGKTILRTRSTAGVSTDRVTVDQAGLAYHRNGNAFLIGKSAVDTTTTGLTLWSDGFGAGRIDYVNANTAATVVCAFYNNNGQVGNIQTSGSATSFNTSSDARLKLHVSWDLGIDVDAIKVHRFAWKSDGSEDIGVFAQELAQVFPQAVTHHEAREIVSREVGADGEVVTTVHRQAEFWGVDYTKLVPVFIAEVQALRARVASLEAEMQALRRRVAALEALS